MDVLGMLRLFPIRFIRFNVQVLIVTIILSCNQLAWPATIQHAGFDGQLTDRYTHWQFLGQGYHRAYNPMLHRFMSQDTMSPFDQGGKNGYIFATNNPIMVFDPTGHFSMNFWLNVGGLSGSIPAIVGAFFGKSMALSVAAGMAASVSTVVSSMAIFGELLHNQRLTNISFITGVASLGLDAVALLTDGGNIALRLMGRNIQAGNASSIEKVAVAADEADAVTNTVSEQVLFEQKRKELLSRLGTEARKRAVSQAEHLETNEAMQKSNQEVLKKLDSEMAYQKGKVVGRNNPKLVRNPLRRAVLQFTRSVRSGDALDEAIRVAQESNQVTANVAVGKLRAAKSSAERSRQLTSLRIQTVNARTLNKLVQIEDQLNALIPSTST